MSNIQSGSRIALAEATDLSEICTRCEADIRGEVFVRDSEAHAPYQPSPYCSLECVAAADDDAYNSEMTNRVGR